METKQHATKKYQWVNDEIKEDIENSLRQMAMKIQPFNIYGMQQKQA